MSRLSDVIGQAIETEMDPFGRLDIPRAIAVALPLLDDDDRETLVSEALAKRIKDAACKTKKAIQGASSQQYKFPFPDLRHAHALDTDGREVILTEAMTEMQMRRLIGIRRKQVADDQAYLAVLEHAYQAVRPLWGVNPDWTFGQVCAAYQENAA